MTQITSLTPEQEALISVYRDNYIESFFKTTELNEDRVKEFGYKMYEHYGFKKPKDIFITDSPLLALDKFAEYFKLKERRWEAPSYYMSPFNYWIPRAMYCQEVLDMELPDMFDDLKQVLELGIFWANCFEDIIIFTKAPTYKRDGEEIHCEDGPAISFPNGTLNYYMWQGLMVPEKLIMRPDELTKNDILKVTNAEIRRCYRERLGAEKYYNIMSDGKGVKVVDEQLDNQGNIMKLMETTIEDDLLNRKVQFIAVMDPSTGRGYDIFNPEQDLKSVFTAKASTFLGHKLSGRQGDVGIVFNQAPDIVIET